MVFIDNFSARGRMAMANEVAKLVSCACGYHGLAPRFLKGGNWDGRKFYEAGWLQTVFEDARCPKCKTNYPDLDIYPADDLRVSLLKKK